MARFRSPFQLVFPGIQQLPLQLQLTRQRLNVFTDLHSFHNLPLELHAVSTPLCHSGPSCHIASIRCKVRLFRVSHFRGSVHNRSCLICVYLRLSAAIRFQPCTRLSMPFQKPSRKARFTILPVPVFGSGVEENSIDRGSLNFAIRCRRNSSSSSALSFSPSLRTTIATGISPHLGSGADTTAHSKTAGCANIAFSTSIDEIFSPPLMMMSFLRSTMWM